MNDNESIQKPEKLVSAILTMLSKYGLNATVYAFKEFVKTGYLDGLTRTNDIRATFQYLGVEGFKEVLEKMYDDTNVYWAINFFINHSLTNASNALNSAIEETFIKYGEHQTQEAVKALILESRCDLFTNSVDSRARDYLVFYGVDSTNVKCLINNILGRDLNQNLSISDINSVIEQSVELQDKSR